MERSRLSVKFVTKLHLLISKTGSKGWRSLVIDLGGQVVLEDSELFDFVLNDKRLLLMQAKSSLCGQRGGLVKHIEVADSELLLDGFSDLDCGVLFTATAVVGANTDGA